jgi:hypothetical protein
MSAFGLAITIMAKIVDITAIKVTVTLFAGKDHDALGTHDIHAGIRKIPIRMKPDSNIDRYLIMVAPILNTLLRQCNQHQ